MARTRSRWTLSASGSLIFASCMLTACEAQMAALSGRTAISPGDFADHDAEANVSERAKAAETFVDSDTQPAMVASAPSMEGDANVLAGEDAVEPVGPESFDREFDAPPTEQDPTAQAEPIMDPQPQGDAGPAIPAPAAEPIDEEPSPATSTAVVGQRVIVDSLIGQVNGRPIYADEFFEPIEDRLIAARQRLSGPDFVAMVEQAIAERLRQVIFNELVLAEAETMLTEEMRVGLRYWLKDVEEQRLAESLGVRAHAEEELAQEGLTLDEYIAMREDEAKIYTLVQKKIEPRVIVTWRDMEREYERRTGEFNPDASVTLAKIVLNKQREPELIDEVETALAQGTSFEEIGATLSRSSAYSEDTYELGEQGLAGLPLRSEILEAIEILEVGETADAVEVEIRSSRPESEPRTTVYWYHIKSIDQPKARSLYAPEVQRQLYNELYRRRQAEEQDRYLESLLGKGIYDDTDEMELRLRRIALLRYGRVQ